MSRKAGEPKECQEQEEYDRTPICPRCEAVCTPGHDWCPNCGRKVTQDRGPVSELDATQYLKRNFGRRLTAFIEDAGLNREETEALFERE